MHTSGLVLTFDEHSEIAEDSRRRLTAAGPFTLGEARGECQAATLEAADPKSAHDWHDWAAGLPGVHGLEVVFVHWDDVEEVNDVGA